MRHARELAAPARSKLLPQLSLWGKKKGKKTGGCAPRQHVLVCLIRWRGLVQTTCEHSRRMRRMRTTSAHAPCACVQPQPQPQTQTQQQTQQQTQPQPHTQPHACSEKRRMEATCESSSLSRGKKGTKLFPRTHSALYRQRTASCFPGISQSVGRVQLALVPAIPAIPHATSVRGLKLLVYEGFSY